MTTEAIKWEVVLERKIAPPEKRKLCPLKIAARELGLNVCPLATIGSNNGCLYNYRKECGLFESYLQTLLDLLPPHPQICPMTLVKGYAEKCDCERKDYPRCWEWNEEKKEIICKPRKEKNPKLIYSAFLRRI